MTISQKCQYAVRAVFELSKKFGQGGVLTIAEISAVQSIPPRFLEQILAQLKQAGYVDSRRGMAGGYLLVSDPKKLAVGEIIRFIDGSLDPVKCTGVKGEEDCQLKGQCVFINLWDRARQAVADVFDKTTFADLLEQEQQARQKFATNYTI